MKERVGCPAEDGVGGSNGDEPQGMTYHLPRGTGAPAPPKRQNLFYPVARFVQEYGVGSQNVRGPLTTVWGVRWFQS